MLKATILREYDIRGAADIELLDAGVETLGQAFGTYLRRPAGRKVNLGRGTRLSSPRLRDALMRGLKVVRRARAELRARHKTVDVAGVRPCSCKAGAWSAHPIPSLSR